MDTSDTVVQAVGEGNSEAAVRFPAEWVCDGESEARSFLADPSEPEGASLVAVRGSGVIGLVAILWGSNYAGFQHCHASIIGHH